MKSLLTPVPKPAVPAVLGSLNPFRPQRCRLGLLSLFAALCCPAVAGATAVPAPPSALLSALLPSPPPAAGSAVDVVPWGEHASWADGRDLGVWWEDPRDIHRVVVTFAGPAPEAGAAKLQWWQSQWPGHRIPRDRPAGAGQFGWGHLGDLHQGRWRDADAYLQTDECTWTFTFRHLNATEFPTLRDFGPEYRTTMKVRLLFDSPPPALERFQAFTDSVWRSVEVGVEWGAAAAGTESWDGELELFNGHLEALAPLVGGPGGSAVELDGPDRWRSTIRGIPDGIRARLWYVESPNANSFDRTVVTVRTKQHSFSFDPAQVAAGETILAAHWGVVVGPVDSIVMGQLMHRRDGIVNASAFNQARERARTNAVKTLYARVFDEPEQSLERALAEQPPKTGRIYLPLGTEGGRQRFGVQPDGSIFCVNDRIDRPPGKDTARRTWGGNRLVYDFDLPKSPLRKRWLEEESLPIVHAEWERDGVRYTQSALVTRLDAGGLGYPDMQADDTAVLMVRIAGRNLDQEYRDAFVVLSLKADGRTVPLTMTDGLVYAQLPEGQVLRAAVECQTDGHPYDDGKRLRFFGNMPPGTDGAMILKIPFITLDQPAELESLRDLDWDEELIRVRRFWKSRADAGTQITTPIPALNQFYRAHLSHLLINCGREVGADRYLARVGSFSYGVFGNESCMMVTDLDRRGLHAEAERCLDTWLHYQGSVKLPGDYSTAEGVFYGARGWEAGGYNQHHGWILWAMAEHYWYSGDRAWLERHADKLVKACHWILDERARTQALEGLRRIERGLLPPGSLEDIGDWRGWLSNNVFSWWGLEAVARALAAIGHPQGEVLQREATAYRRDLLAAFHEASVRSPLVPLRDGTWIPQIPSEVHRRGRTFGWITVTLEGSIYLLRTGLLSPDDPLAVPILQDYEDNLYLSDHHGYSWTEHGEHWFSRGGISMQPNLLCSPHPYLLRDEIQHYLRAYFNAFASCYYPDTQMLCEHPLPDLGDWRGDHYKSSDESNSTYWLRLMFIEDDRGDHVLRLGLALPRAWLADGQRPSIEHAATHFGPMSLRFESKAASGSIAARIDPPTRRPPKTTYLRFRHPEAKRLQRVELDGRPWDKFDPDKEWVELPSLSQPTTVTAFY